MQYRVLGITWDAVTSFASHDYEQDDPFELAIARIYNDPEEGRPITAMSYRDFALVLDYESDNHDWQHDRSRVLFDEIMEGWSQ